MSQLFATKSMEQLRAEAAETGEHSLKRVLGPVNLITLGIGAIIGTGIFVLTGPGRGAVRRAGHRAVDGAGGRGQRVSRACATRSSRRGADRRVAPTPTATPRWASSSPGSSAGT